MGLRPIDTNEKLAAVADAVPLMILTLGQPRPLESV
jgi:hypothetical protein